MKHEIFSHFVTIGMVHFSPLEGSDGYEGKEIVLERAKQDLAMLLEGGVDMVMFENNFDTPKFSQLPNTVARHFEELLQELVPETTVLWGIAPLWNDYRFGFEMCHKYGGMMVRVPVFVDSVETVYGTFLADPKKVLETRKELDAEEVLLLADVQVKHATMLHPRPFIESVKEAREQGADGVIVTGSWTGDPPSVEQCAQAHHVADGHCLVLTGSGMTPENLKDFKPYLNGSIVGTAFKEKVGIEEKGKPNIVGPEVRYSPEAIARFMKAARQERG
ncbi:MAG: hypothetical protein UU08_C0024G0004 [Candidatus Uhrbacteria bacterium GW2011_GWE2_40_58]|nr:MAG: hypothetical protein UT94_C0013G0004 [Candidatus Uhrbacteria bacterium GW2011_GWF2_40_263]KKR67193.1 MAG: hypothetical protein UU08_C0024G0004 [Candidatus Uhrbacteria bacterium GW2011_GWE2_40_58]OGL93756.1 MAG: hypothetical protein A2239_01870 [Candidatus Uhrbacteria bacterium RIFOXYA2_FULL_40_9]OGL96612.1 MAG: hypothetical protein A2332_03195 [Candidatus Uhrbacteria bacterium RIFOXYB2_FULL_41_18]HBK34597.1 hypothetical protein [Candidatus Uhrbacteria bacterium]